ncbi:MAG TPA: exonuclease subunit SbcD, partial [Dehalococcoidia bacterium]|nr:exonuclease subunit SbcD [Dehalococcoidia bacterium]
MIRAIHFSDLHIGVERYGQIDPSTGLSSRLGDFLRALDGVIDYAIGEQIDLVVFAGDAYKTRDPSPTHQREFARRLLRLSRAGVQVFLLVGNHDLPMGINRATAIDIFETLAIPNITVGNRIKSYLIQTRSGPVQVVAVPWIVRTAVLSRDEYRNLPIEDVNRLIEEKVNEHLDAAIVGLDPDVPAILAGHLSIADARYGSERSVMIGQDVVFLHSTIARRELSYVALGHIHKHQTLGGNPPVVYSGSL